MAAGPRALPDDLALLLPGRLAVRDLADLAVGGADPRLRSGERLADHLRDDTSGRRQLPVEGRRDRLVAVHRDAALAETAAVAAPAAECRPIRRVALGQVHDGARRERGRAGRAAVDAVARDRSQPSAGPRLGDIQRVAR